MTHNDSQVEAVKELLLDFGTAKWNEGISDGAFDRVSSRQHHKAATEAYEAILAALSALAAGKVEASAFDRDDVEAVAACLGDDAVQLREESFADDEDERAENMDRAASMLTWMLLTHPAYANAASPSPLSADPESAVVGAAKGPHYYEQMRLTLIGQVHELIDIAGRHAWVDDVEERRRTEGAIAHARKVIAPYNYNGTLPHPALDRANAGERAGEPGWELVGHFMEDGGRWLKMDNIYANDPDAVPLYRKRNAGVSAPIPHTFAPPDADTGYRTDGGKNG